MFNTSVSPVNFQSVRTINLTHNQTVSIAVNLTIFFVLIFISAFLLIWYRKKSKGFNLIFIFYLLFWIPIFLGRDFRSKMNNAIINSGIYLASSTITMVMIGYGFVGIFARIFADYWSYLFKYRKVFLYFAILVNIACFIPIICVQNGATNIIQVIGVGVSASCIGTVELLFKQKSNNKAFLSVSLLSIPPLLANFITAPIESTFTVLSSSVNSVTNKLELNRPDILKYMWVIGLVCLLICFVLVIFIKERKIYHENWDYKKVYNFKEKTRANQIIYFAIVSFIGALIMFVKFSNSGAIGLNHLKVLAEYNNTNSSAYEGYLSLIFSLAQLAAGVLVGTLLIRKMNVTKIFSLGCGIWITYLISVIFIKNPYAFFAIHALNGFAYGILYNLLLALILNISINTSKVTSMGIYQSILSIGIMCSGWFTTWMKEILPKNNTEVYFHNSMIVNVVLIFSIFLAFLVFLFLSLYLKKNDKIFYNTNLETKKEIKIWKKST